MPREKDCANNQTAYCSGHYEHCGVNCLGICDVEVLEGTYFFVSYHQEKQNNVVFQRWMSRNFERNASWYILYR